MKLSGYIIIVLWTAAMTGGVYYGHTLTRDARSELAGIIFNDPTAGNEPAPAARMELAVQSEINAPSEAAVRSQLASGLASLKSTLEGYSVKLAQGQAEPNAAN